MEIKTKIEDVIYQVQYRIDNQDVILDIEYSGEEDSLEFECVRVSEDNLFDDDEMKLMEDEVESGIEEDVVFQLKRIYSNTSVKFSSEYERD